MIIDYSSSDMKNLLSLIEKERHLADIDYFLHLARRIANDLECLQRQAEDRLFRLNNKIMDLSRTVDAAEAQKRQAQKNLENTPRFEAVYRSPDSVQKGEKPELRPINQDAVHKYKSSIDYYGNVAYETSQSMDRFEEIRKKLSPEAEKIREYLTCVSEAIQCLEYHRRRAKEDCHSFKGSIKYAAGCMENYAAVEYGGGRFDPVSHAQPKEGW
ncbi:MAG: hypothetical protein IJD75_07620 [Clostridia bacterium]|nr:hypothetical protein [Clostridia bacterium]MBQ3014984.1 hypothetical protein [Clostridia bacterium]